MFWVERSLPTAGIGERVGEDEAGVGGQLVLLHDGGDPVRGPIARPF